MFTEQRMYLTLTIASSCHQSFSDACGITYAMVLYRTCFVRGSVFIANPKHVDIAFKHRGQETNKKNIKTSNGYHKQHHNITSYFNIS